MLFRALAWLLYGSFWIGFAVLVGAGVLVLVQSACFRRRYDVNKCTVAFFHPYCDAGGGGERVLWCAIAALAGVRERRWMKVIVYTGDVGVMGDDLLRRASERFGVDVPPDLDLEFVYVQRRHLLEAARYPRFTMLGQSWGSMVLAWECLTAANPDVFIDTTGCAFTMVVAKLLARCRTAAYVHYPTITTDMITRVVERRPTYNNDERVAGSMAATWSKVAYYRLFAALYRGMGGLHDAIMVNSSWTKGHIDALWTLPVLAGARPPVPDAMSAPSLPTAITSASDDVLYRPCMATAASVVRALGFQPRLTRPAARIVYPPCNTATLAALPLAGRERLVVSIAQFRPEKDHALQLRAMAAFRAKGERHGDVKLMLIGGCRDEGDRHRVVELQQLVARLRLTDCVHFAINVPLAELRSILGRATAGLHTMWNEHFGIGVVEMQAAGVIPIAHNSGGPRSDIVLAGRTGYLATTEEEYADALQQVFDAEPPVQHALAAAARASATSRFSDEQFSLAFFAATIGLVHDGLDDARERRVEEDGAVVAQGSGRHED